MRFIHCCFITILLLGFFPAFANTHELISLFPLKNYNQKVIHWVNPTSMDYDKPLLSSSMQKRHLEQFHKKYLSPWDKIHVTHIIEETPSNNIKTIEEEYLRFFSNNKKSDEFIGYGENYKPYSKKWIKKIRENMQLGQLKNIHFDAKQRAIAINNTYARVLPTEDVHFYSHKIAGQGYPFDNLQMSAVWAGTPLYVIAETKDHAWALVLTPDYVAWVKSSAIARTSDHFIMMWVHQTRRQLAAIIRSETALLDDEKHYLFSGYVGMVFPATEQNDHLRLTIPVADNHRKAIIKYITISKKDAHLLPLSPTPRHFATLFTTLINRPYGWGNMYFYNDCSSELKNLYVPFGIWLSRHSSEQVLENKMVDLSHLSPKKRLDYLMKHGRKLVTIVYINGHVFMYLGNYKNPHTKKHALMAMTYQNVWGLKPSSSQKRAVIGQSVFLPLLLKYPEDPNITSQASRKYFRIAFLDEPINYVKNPKKVNLRNIIKTED